MKKKPTVEVAAERLGVLQHALSLTGRVVKWKRPDYVPTPEEQEIAAWESDTP